MGAAALLGCLAWWLGGHTAPALESAAALRGERYYRLLLDDRHVGYLHTHTYRDRLGRWSFDSDLRFVLTVGSPVRVEERLVFAAAPPFQLLEARQRSERPGDVEGTLISHAGDGYRVRRLNGHGQQDDGRLREHKPLAGATVRSAALDFSRRRVVARQFRVVGRNATGWELENPAPLNATRIQLDARLRPVTMTLSGLFELELASREQALAPRTALQAASYFVPTDRRLPRHTEINALELEVTGATASELWPDLTRNDTLLRRANAVSTPVLHGDELDETADHPVSDPRIRDLARRAVAGIDAPGDRVGALTRFVNDYLRYEPGGVRRHVLALLDEPRGDCSEFADLLTTLARSLDIPSRTVFGLAYADGAEPAFRFHAWNELLVDGAWQVVDPTWNQLRVDATHIPMPTDAGRALEILTGGLELAFVVRDVEYF